MADVLVLDAVATHNFSENIHTNNGSLCDYVTQLKQELHGLRIEIKSLNKIQNYDQNNIVLHEGNQRDECTRCSEISRTLQTTVEELKSAQLIIKMLHDEINQSNTSSYINSNEPSTDIGSSAYEWNRVKRKHLWKMCKQVITI